MERKVVIITGGSSGIGLATIKYLLEEKNYEIISISRKKENILKAKEYLKEEAENVTFISADVSSQKDCKRVYEEISQKYTKIDGLVNSAGIIKTGGIEKATFEEWNYSIQNNLNSQFLITKELLPLLKNSVNSSIVNISSISAQTVGSSIAYSVSKAGVDMFTKCLAHELGKYNIRVNAVSPGIVRSNLQLSNGVFETNDEYLEFLQSAKEKYPLGRIGEPQDIAPTIEFLLSEKSCWTTGTIVVIDGGKLTNN